MSERSGSNMKMPPARPGAVGRAFTLIELVAVVTLLLVVLGIAVPAFTNMIRASERSLAENTLRVGVAVARDLAVLNGQDSGLLFVREESGRTRLIPVIRVGTIDDAVISPFSFDFVPNDPTTAITVEREVYAPVDFASTLQMPRGWSIAGYADAGSIDRLPSTGGVASPFSDGWYDSIAYGDNGTVTMTPDPVRAAGHWVLPETDLYEKFMQGHGVGAAPNGFTSRVNGTDALRTPRQSFMLRFESGTGLLRRGGRAALVLDPRPTSLGRLATGNENRWTRANRIEDAVAWTARVLDTLDVDDMVGYNLLTDEDYRLELIGNFSNDTVLAGAVSRLAIFEEAELAAGLGARGLNRETNSLYEPIATQGRISFDMSLFDGSTAIQDPEDVRLGITRWIQGDTSFLDAGTFDSDSDGDGSVYGDPDDAPVARIYFVHPGTGELTEVGR